MEPASVICESSALAMPKSVTFTVPAVSIRMFCDLMSRCTMCASWATWTPASSSRAMRTASPGL